MILESNNLYSVEYDFTRDQYAVFCHEFDCWNRVSSWYNCEHLAYEYFKKLGGC